MPKPILTCSMLSCLWLAVVQECILMHLIGVEPQQLNALQLANALWPHTPANSKRLVKCKVRGLSALHVHVMQLVFQMFLRSSVAAGQSAAPKAA